ncbi:MAG: hypothetical protein J7J70_04925 [Deltaproteobacteria bacterium]|nr:hypothetical protein [Candidatus Tharpellaceae bacterium]
MNDIYGLVRGPLALAAIVLFVAGLIYQAQRFYSLTRERSTVLPPASVLGKVGQRSGPSLDAINNSVLGVHPYLTVITSIIHTCLIIVPIFLLAHNVLLYESWGFNLFTLPEQVSNVLTIMVILGGVFFFLRRLFVYRVRAITTLYDYIILLIVIVPFLTGYMAAHQWFDYQTIMIVHILAGEVMLVAIPFTKLKHGLLFFLYRYLMHYEHSLGSGTRVWSYSKSVK